MMKLVLAAAVALSLSVGPQEAPSEETRETRSEDELAVEAAIQDYISAFYDIQPELIESSVHPDVAKFGFFRPSEDAPYRESPITFDALVDLAGSLNQSGWIGEDAPRKVTLFEVLDRTAAASCRAAWGIDFLHLAKYGEDWKIVQVLWQSHPNPAADAPR